jgi:hypothetical protein
LVVVNSAVQETWHTQLFGGPSCKVVARRTRVVDGRVTEWDERNHVNNPEPRVFTDMVRDVESFYTSCGKESGRLGRGQSEHTAVVIGICVDVEEMTRNRPCEAGQQGDISALADVDHALQHGPFIAL